jgi:hypothetical protein
MRKLPKFLPRWTALGFDLQISLELGYCGCIEESHIINNVQHYTVCLIFFPTCLLQMKEKIKRTEIQVVLLDALQLLMLSAGTLISLEDRMFPLIIFYYKQDTYCLYVISLLNSIVYIIFFSFLNY